MKKYLYAAVKENGEIYGRAYTRRGPAMAQISRANKNIKGNNIVVLGIFEQVKNKYS